MTRTTTGTISVPEYFQRNRRFFNETKDCALMQVRTSADAPWVDYARGTIEEADHQLRMRLRDGEAGLWRVVDWMYKGDEIDFRKDLPTTTEPYVAINGHRMVAPVTGWDYYRAYQDDGPLRLRSTSYNAGCTDDCGACASGEDLPDW